MLSNNSGNESVVDPLSITSEITLIGVELVLTSTIIPPFFLIYLGNFAEGLTKVDVPTTNIKSEVSIYFKNKNNIKYFFIYIFLRYFKRRLFKSKKK